VTHYYKNLEFQLFRISELHNYDNFRDTSKLVS